MLEDINKLQDQVGILVNWVAEMKTLTQNPYSAGLNIHKVLEDLGGYAADLTKAVYELEKRANEELRPEVESSETNSDSAEQ